MWLTLYILSVLVSAALLWKAYLTEKHIYKFSTKEKILGLVVVPLIPVANLILAALQVF